MQVMIAEYVLFPALILDFKHWFLQTADEALVFYFDCNLSFFISLGGKWVNDDSKEDIHENNVNNEKEWEIKDISVWEVCIIPIFRLNFICNTSSSSQAILSGEKKAFSKLITWSFINIVSPVLRPELSESKERENIEDNKEEKQSVSQS